MSAESAHQARIRAILDAAPRPKRPHAARSVLTLAWRALLKIKHVPFQLFDVTAMPIMFTLLFTFLFGGALGGSPKEYAQYLAPGMLVQTIIFITVYSGVGLNTDIQKGLFDRFRSLPMWQPAPIFGALAGDVLRYTFASIMVLSVSFAIGFRPEAGILGLLGALGLVLFFAFAVSWIWIIVGMLVKTPESVMTMSFLLLFPLTFVSNIFVKPETMPGWLAGIVKANPVTHLADAARGLVDGNANFMDDVFPVLIAACCILVVFVPLAMWMYHRER